MGRLTHYTKKCPFPEMGNYYQMGAFAYILYLSMVCKYQIRPYSKRAKWANPEQHVQISHMQYFSQKK